MTITEAILTVAFFILWGISGVILLRSWLTYRDEHRQRWRDRQWPKQKRQTIKAHSALKAVEVSQTKARKLIVRRPRKPSARLQDA